MFHGPKIVTMHIGNNTHSDTLVEDNSQGEKNHRARLHDMATSCQNTIPLIMSSSVSLQNRH